ncbi:MAG TPA: leucyl aminopeptidase [Actinomycetota bacterium]|nr:leucyl aminopeptidase [Actinomycetota bacterium]
MPGLEIGSSTDAAQDATADVLIMGAWGGASPSIATTVGDPIDATLEAQLVKVGFKAKTGETCLLPAPEGISATGVLIVGLGSRDAADAATVRKAAGASVRRASSFTHAASLLHSLPVEGAAEAAAEGTALGGYSFDAYRSKQSDRTLTAVTFVGGDDPSIGRAMAFAGAVKLARDLINEPPSSLTPKALAAAAEAACPPGSVKVKQVDELQRDGFGGIVGVGQGSSEPPCLIMISYAPAGEARGRVALVGKGITFDSGGLSLKDAKGMETMKTDMSGAAAVIGVMSALPALELPIAVDAFIPAAENMPSGTAIKPGDVITQYGGRTTEVLNTDAEGRLVLADAIALAAESKPDAIIDVATLTGSIVVALGKKITGLFANDDPLRDALLEAARRAGEPLWAMPIFEEYRKDLESEIADQKNIGTRYGGSIIGALFLSEFVPQGVPWAHLDIAGTARAETDSDESPKGGTGVATRTLLHWLRTLSGGGDN